MKIYISLIIALISYSVNADECTNAMMSSWSLQEKSFSASQRVNESLGSSPERLLKQFEDLTEDLSLIY
jgi:hypothetical protein